MKTVSLLGVTLLAAVCAGNAHALFKCTTARGIVYQDRPCAEGTEEDIQIVNSSMPESAPGYAQDQVVVTKSDRGRKEPPVMVAKAGRKADAAKYAGADTGRRDTGALGEEGSPTYDPTRNPAGTRYYAAFGSAEGGSPPQNITCQTPTGEKWQFFLQGGK